ncbi:MAG: hypothetical protein JXA01_04675 [Dehalococcoidia bacterium]|nr:hypothetical protein [Dehalococcoidia bacterium]
MDAGGGSSFIRANRDTERFRKDSRLWFWGVEVIGATLFGLCGGIVGFKLLPLDSTPFQQFILPCIGTSAGLILGLVFVYLMIYLWNLFRAPYKQRDKFYGDLQLLKQRYSPSNCAQIIASAPNSEIGKFVDREIGIDISNICAVYTTFRNVSKNISAKNVWADISYHNSEGSIILELDGVWNECCDPEIIKNFSGDIREVELKPNGPSYNMVLAFKYLTDEHCYAYNHSNSTVKGLRRSDYQLRDKQFKIVISLHGQNLSNINTFAYTVINHGKNNGISIEPELVSK